jgi:hypothetical protein
MVAVDVARYIVLLLQTGMVRLIAALVNEARPKPEHSTRSGGRERGGSPRGRGRW